MNPHRFFIYLLKFILMKTTLLTIFMVLTFNAFGQNDPQTLFAVFIDFETPHDSFTLSLNIDTINSDNIWQIGQPQKTVFNQAESIPNALITDTMNTYPINNVSSFVVNYPNYNCPEFHGSYYADTDTLNDYGTIELSTDNGQTWIDLLNDNTNSTSISKPILTGNSNGWQFFSLVFYDYVDLFEEDSIWVKFTFISDSIDTQHDGLMFDNLAFCISGNSQNLYQLNNLKVFPNPTSDVLNFQFEELIDNAEIRIYSTIGQLMQNQNIINTNVQFDISSWNKGIYFYGIYVEGELVQQGQVLVQD